MEYRSLGRTGAQVSQICLGAMAFGWKTDQQEASRIVDRFLDTGGNFIDTANVYARGVSEEMTGNALSGGKRDRVFLATKVHGKMGEGPNDWGNTRFHILRQCEESLRRLKTDHVDLYQIHRPRRRSRSTRRCGPWTTWSDPGRYATWAPAPSPRGRW